MIMIYLPYRNYHLIQKRLNRVLAKHSSGKSRIWLFIKKTHKSGGVSFLSNLDIQLQCLWFEALGGTNVK